MTDPIADMITRIKNAGLVKKASVALPYSKLKHAVAEKLVKSGYVKSVDSIGKGIERELEIGLLYDGPKHRIIDVKRVSKPSRRIYFGHQDIRPVRQGFGDLILSTPEGIVTGDEARKKNVGGEVLFKIW
jgi:small subunit ribosomal protein S8